MWRERFGLAEAELDRKVKELLDLIYKLQIGSAATANLWEHLHYYQGCPECKARWERVDPHNPLRILKVPM